MLFCVVLFIVIYNYKRSFLCDHCWY